MARLAFGLCLAGLILAGCSGSGDTSGCGFSEQGERVDLRGSGIECGEANALLNVLLDIKRPQIVKSGQDRWVCVFLPENRLPVRARCHRGARSFTLLRSG